MATSFLRTLAYYTLVVTQQAVADIDHPAVIARQVYFVGAAEPR